MENIRANEVNEVSEVNEQHQVKLSDVGRLSAIVASYDQINI